MAGRDLRALFSTNDPHLVTEEAFTNREAQWDLVAAALTDHLQHISAPGFDVTDFEAPRTNVMVFHGVGGIGKSTLSRKLEAALAGAEHRPPQWGAPVWPGGRILPIRIDLARSAGNDFERVVLTIRLALAELGHPLPAFDLALRRYWEHQHPGEPLEEYLRRGGLAARAGKALPQQMQSVLADVAQALLLPGTVGSVVGEVTGSLVRALSERRQSVRALAGCTRLADLLQAEPDIDALSYYPHLLAWELAQLPPAKRVAPVILLDTFEDTGDRTHRDLERLLQRVVWLMPNAFFVITGRSRLQWADDGLQGQLDWTGRTAWPGLADQGIPQPRLAAARPQRQVLIGDFSLEDCTDYLARRLTRTGQPLIDEHLRAVIAARSHGLPLYLDLAVLRFLEIRRTGRRPHPADFDVDFPALIARTLSDLTPEERHVLRSVALLDSFDLALATRAAGVTHEAPALRLIERPFVQQNDFGLWPFHLHALIRSTIRTADDQTDDRWSPRDWREAAERAFTALGEQWDTSLTSDRMLLIGCLRQGLTLAHDFRLDLGWLTAAAWAYVSDSVWEPLSAAAGQEPANTPETAADALVELLSTLARRQHESRERTEDRLTALVHTGLLPAELHEMGIYYLAKAQRDLGRTEASRTGMQLVMEGGGRLAPAARRGLAHLARLAGDFPAAHAAAENLGWAGRQHRVLGDVLWPHGDIHRAAGSYAAARDQAEQHGVAGERATSQAQRAFALAFSAPALADDEINLAQQLLTGLDLRATSHTVQIAALARDAGITGNLAAARALRGSICDAGITATSATLELTLAFHHAVRNEPDEVRTVITRLRELTTADDHSFYVDIAHYMADLPLPGPSSVVWLSSDQSVREHWLNLVSDRREHLRSTR